MGRYPDSSTTLRPTPDGTKWDSGNPDDYSDAIIRDQKQGRNKRPSTLELKELEELHAKDVRKALRSFISQCAKAYLDPGLTAT